MTQSFELLEDLQETYASQYNLTILFTDSTGELLIPPQGDNPLFNTLFQQGKVNLLDKIKESLSEDWNISRPIVFDILPGIHVVVAPVYGREATYFLWAGVMLEEKNQELVKRQLDEKVSGEVSWEECFNQTPILTKESKKQWIQRTNKLAKLAALCLQKETQMPDSNLPTDLLQEATQQKGLDVPELLPRFLGHCEEFDFLGLAELVDEDTYQVTQITGDGSKLIQGATFSPGEGFLGRVLLTGKRANWENIEHDPRSLFFHSYSFHPKSLFCEPINLRDGAVSLLFGGSFTNRWLSGKESALGRTLGILLEISLSMRSLKLENTQQLNRLSSLVDICKLMASTPDFKRILYILVDISINLVEGPFSFVLLKDRESEKVKLVSRGSANGDLEQYVHDAYKRYHHFSMPIFPKEQEPHLFTTESGDQVVECPLFHGEELLGILCVGITNQSEGQLQEHLAFLHTLSIIGGVSLQLMRQGDTGSYEEKIETLYKAVEQFDSHGFSVAEEAALLSVEFTTHLGLSATLAKDILHASQLSIYSPEFIKSIIPDGKVSEIVENGKVLSEDIPITNKSLGDKASKVFAFNYTYVKNEHDLESITHLREVDEEMYQQFLSFVSGKQVTEQEFTPSASSNSSRDIKSIVMAVKEQVNLSAREQEVLELVMEGLNNREIAEKLYISDHTVKNHVTKIFKKLGVADRANAISKAYQIIYHH